MYSFDGGTIHFNKVAKGNQNEVLQLTQISHVFKFFEFVRKSLVGRFLRRCGLIARFEFFASLFIKLPNDSTYIVPTDSILFLLILSKCKSCVLYSYDLPWTYYTSKERNYVKNKLINALNKFDKIKCISRGMYNEYIKLGLKNVEIIRDFISAIQPLENNSILGRKPLYVGNVRFKKEFKEVLSVLTENVTHYGKKIEEFDLNNMGFKPNLDYILEKNASKYYGICVFSFSETDYDLAISSIPSKILTYNKIGIPIIYYGPKYSEGYILCKENKLGKCFDKFSELKSFLKNKECVDF